MSAINRTSYGSRYCNGLGKEGKSRRRVNSTGSIYDNVKNGDNFWLAGHRGLFWLVAYLPTASNHYSSIFLLLFKHILLCVCVCVRLLFVSLART